MLAEWTFQTVSTPFNIFKNKENVESMLNESLNQFKSKFNSTRFQQAFNIFYTFNNVERPVQTLRPMFKHPARHLVQQSVERMLKQMLKLFKWAFAAS